MKGERTRVERPRVEVIDTISSEGPKKYVVITRGDGRTCSSHETRGGSENERLTNIVTDLLGDRRTAEHLP
jgi:hypothetical protein